MSGGKKLFFLKEKHKNRAIHPVTHEEIRHAMDQFFAKGGAVTVLEPQKYFPKNAIDEDVEPVLKSLQSIVQDPLTFNVVAAN